MATNRSRRTRKIIKKDLAFSVKYYLENGCFPPRELFPSRPGMVELFMMGKKELRAAWLIHREEILRDWKLEKRRGKPWAEKVFKNADE